MYLAAYRERQKAEEVNAILTGYYAAYYTNGGKKAKNPKELIRKIYAKKQSLEDGLREIEKLKKAEERKDERYGE